MMIKTTTKLVAEQTGVYGLHHLPTDLWYIGSSKRCIANRYSHHVAMLKTHKHNCSKLLSLWLRTKPEEWEFVIFKECTISDDRKEESEYLVLFGEKVLNSPGDARGAGRITSHEVRLKQSQSRAKYLETEGARESLAERAVLQHAQGRFGEGNFTKKLAGVDADTLYQHRCRAIVENRKTVSCTGYRGVFPHTRGYFAYINHKGKRRRLGVFDNAVDAARAYDRECIALRGDMAIPNFPKENYQ